MQRDAIDIDSNLYFAAGTYDFLIRPNDESPNDYYLLCVRTSTGFHECRIENNDVFYTINNLIFDSLQELIDYYHKHPIVEEHQLAQPLPCQAFNPNSIDREQITDEKVWVRGYYNAVDDLNKKLWNEKIHSGDLELLSEQTDYWKKVHVKLMYTTTGCRLYIYATSNHIKHMDSVEMSHTSLYKCHESLWGSRFCFQIYEIQGTAMFFRSANNKSYLAWIRALQIVCLHQLRKCRNEISVRQSFEIVVKSAKKLADCNTYCLILLDQFRVARTLKRSGPDIIWDEKFNLQ